MRATMWVLGVESSCDETAVALCDERGQLRAHQVYSQVKLHDAYGGVVPELASRDHIRKLMPLVDAALDEAGVRLSAVEGVGYTAGPGLAGALLVGAMGGRALAFALGVPALPVNHLEGHVLAPLLEDDSPDYPFLCLLVSGGHSELVRVDGLGRYERLGGTIDDAAGEAFDKTAKLLGLGYPGGAALAALAEAGDPSACRFPRPMLDRPGLDLSFSGLKTAVAVACERHRAAGEALPAADIAAAFQAAVVDTLAAKMARAMAQTGLSRLVVAGGVGANRALRARLEVMAREAGGRCHYPRSAFCTDNAAMIALVAAQRLAAGERDPGCAVSVRPRWPLDEMRPPVAA